MSVGRPALRAKVSFGAIGEPPALCHDLGNPLARGDEKLLLFRAHAQRRARQGLFRSGAGNEHLRDVVTAAFARCKSTCAAVSRAINPRKRTALARVRSGPRSHLLHCGPAVRGDLAAGYASSRTTL